MAKSQKRKRKSKKGKYEVPKQFKFLFKNKWQKKQDAIAFYGGRGGGKTMSIASYLVLEAVNKPINIVCAREYQNSIKDSVKKILEERIEYFELENYFKITRDEIHSTAGAIITFKGIRNNPGSFKGTSGIDICWIEEASYISEESWDIVIPTVYRSGSHYRYGKMIVSYNPLSIRDPVYQVFQIEKPKRTKSIEVSLWTNPFAPPPMLREAERMRINDPEKFQHIYLGQAAVTGSDIVFRDWEIKDLDNFPMHDDVRNNPYVGMDFGFRDPTCAVAAYFSLDQQQIYVREEVYHKELGVLDYPSLVSGSGPTWRNIHNFEGLYAVREQGAEILADAARPDTIKDMRDMGLTNIKEAAKGKDSIEEGIEFLQGKHIIIHPRCKNLIREFQNYRYDRDKQDPTIINFHKFVDADNHCIDALRYAVSLIRKHPQFDVQDTGHLRFDFSLIKGRQNARRS